MIVFVQKSFQDDEKDTVPVAVGRRSVSDIYFVYNASNHEACNEGSKITYLVQERRCISDHDLLKGK